MVGFVLTITEREILTLTLINDSPEYMHNDFVSMELRNRTVIFDHSGNTKNAPSLHISRMLPIE